MGVASIRRSWLPIILCFFVGGSFAATCKYECEQTGGCTAKYSGPPRSGNTIGSCFSRFFGGACSGTPPECQDCKEVIQCERNSSISTSGAVVSKHAGYGYEYVEYNQPPSVNYKCPIDPGTPNDDCTPESPCSLGEGPCTERDTCENGLRCGNKNCGNFPGNSNSDANCCYDPYRPGEGSQLVFDTNTVLGQQLEKTLDWLDEADFETTVSCCSKDGPVEKKCGGGPNKPKCRTICGNVTKYHLAFDEFDNTQCSADLFYRNTNIWKLDDVCPAPKTWVPYVPDYSTYQSLPSYNRGKRQTRGKQADCNKDDNEGCSVEGNAVSLDVTSCKMMNVYSPESILQFPSCCLSNFMQNAIAQGRRQKRKKNFKKTAKKCCEKYSVEDKSQGVDALKYCQYSK